MIFIGVSYANLRVVCDMNSSYDVKACSSDRGVSIHSFLTLFDQTGWDKGGALDFVFEHFLVRIPSVTLAILAEIFRGFPRSQGISCGIVSGLDRDRLLLNPFQYVLE